jgi:hypothetical protein
VEDDVRRDDVRLAWARNDGTDEAVTRLYASRPKESLHDPARREGPLPGDAEPPKERIRPGRESNLFKSLSLRPDAGALVLEAINAAHFDFDGHLPQRVKQMIATYTAALRSCPY